MYIPQAQYLVDRLHQRSRILDFGCGNGKISRYLRARHRFEVTGVDISPEAIRLAQSSHDGIDYHLIEPDQIPASAGGFDAAVSSHVFCTFDRLDDYLISDGD